MCSRQCLLLGRFGEEFLKAKDEVMRAEEFKKEKKS